MAVIGGGRGVEVTGVGGGYQGNRVRAQQGVRDSRRGREGAWREEDRRAGGGRGKRRREGARLRGGGPAEIKGGERSQRLELESIRDR